MKKLVGIVLLLLPILTLAQNPDLSSVDQFFDTYGKQVGYDHLNMNEKMIKQIAQDKKTDQELRRILKKLKGIKYMEDQGKMAYGKMISSKMPMSGSITYIHYVPYDSLELDGIKKSGKWNTIPATDIYLKHPSSESVLVEKALSEIDLSAFTERKNWDQDGRKLILYQRKTGSGLPEYLLLNGNTMINLIGKRLVGTNIKIEEMLKLIYALEV